LEIPPTGSSFSDNIFDLKRKSKCIIIPVDRLNNSSYLIRRIFFNYCPARRSKWRNGNVPVVISMILKKATMKEALIPAPFGRKSRRIGFVPNAGRPKKTFGRLADFPKFDQRGRNDIHSIHN
jgi:hypothetical protein